MKTTYAPFIVACLAGGLLSCGIVGGAAAGETEPDPRMTHPSSFYADEGFLLTGRGKSIHWDALPIRVVTQFNAAGCDPAAHTAAGFVNGVFGAEVIVLESEGAHTVRLEGDDLRFLGRAPTAMAFTELTASEATGEIVLAAIFIRRKGGVCDRSFGWWILAHEFFHLLGLADDGENVWSLMSATLNPSLALPPLTEKDRALLFSQYGNRRIHE